MEAKDIHHGLTFIRPQEEAWLANRIRRLSAGVYNMPEPVTKLLGRMFGVIAKRNFATIFHGRSLHYLRERSKVVVLRPAK